MRWRSREIAAFDGARRPPAPLYSMTSMWQPLPYRSTEIETFSDLASLRRIYNAPQASGLSVGRTTRKPGDKEEGSVPRSGSAETSRAARRGVHSGGGSGCDSQLGRRRNNVGRMTAEWVSHAGPKPLSGITVRLWSYAGFSCLVADRGRALVGPAKNTAVVVFQLAAGVSRRRQPESRSWRRRPVR